MNILKPTKRQYEEIPYYRTGIQHIKLIDKIKNNPSLYELFKKRKDITKQVDEDINQRMNGSIKNFVAIFIEASQGSLKSSLAMSIAERNDISGYNIDRISFTYDDFQKNINNSTGKQWFQLDEVVWKHGLGTNRLIHDIETLLETLRKKQLSMILISPQIKYFDEKIFSYLLEPIDSRVIAKCPHNKKPHEIRTCQCFFQNNFEVLYADVRALVKQEGRYLGYYTAPIKWNSPLWQEYEKRKDEYMEKAKKNEHNESPYMKLAEEAISKPDAKLFLSNKKAIKLLLLREYPYLTTEETNLVLEAVIILSNKPPEEIITGQTEPK